MRLGGCPASLHPPPSRVPLIRRIPPPLLTPPTMDPYIQRRLRHYRTMGVKRVKARASGRTDECGHCKALDGVAYDIDNVPDFPPRGCTCAVGCGCSLTHVPNEGVLQVTMCDDTRNQTETAAIAPASTTIVQSDATGASPTAREYWGQFFSAARLMMTSSAHLLRLFGIRTAWILARGAAHCIHFISTTFPALAKRAWAGAKEMLRQRGKSLSTWASITLTSRNPPT
jgi:hypothetical protein